MKKYIYEFGDTLLEFSKIKQISKFDAEGTRGLTTACIRIDDEIFSYGVGGKECRDLEYEKLISEYKNYIKAHNND